MPQRANVVTTLADQVKDLLRKGLANGWSNTRVAHEMTVHGHPWTENVVRTVISEKSPRMLTVDEAAALMAIFKGDARLVTKHVDKVAAEIEAAAKGGRR
jgi:hypothetical protein